MLPGLVTLRLFELTCDSLNDIWRKTKCSRGRLDQTREEQLARVLHDGWDGDEGSGDKINTCLVAGIKLGRRLVELEKQADRPADRDMVKVILAVWVDMLFHASFRCSKESHARRLAYGGELTTIVWLLAEHAGLFISRETTKGMGGRKVSKEN
ncbi:unnamed protein product [Urochloa humidicola]